MTTNINRRAGIERRLVDAAFDDAMIRCQPVRLDQHIEPA
jgi:hypothetical protein